MRPVCARARGRRRHRPLRAAAPVTPPVEILRPAALSLASAYLFLRIAERAADRCVAAESALVQAQAWAETRRGRAYVLSRSRSYARAARVVGRRIEALAIARELFDVAADAAERWARLYAAERRPPERAND